MKKILTLSLIVVGILHGVRASASSAVQLQNRKIKQVKSTAQGKQIFRYVEQYSKQYRVDKRTIHAIIIAESNYNPKAVSSDGAVGLMQILPSTARSRGCTNPYSIEQNIKYGTKHYAGLLAKYRGNEHLALAAYNCGGGYVDRYKGKVPPHSKRYIKRIMNYKKVELHI